MSDVNRIIDDKRAIRGVWNDEGQTGAGVDFEGVTRIDTYEEDGQMAAVTWFRVWRGDKLWKRFNAAFIAEVEYVEAKP